MKSKTVDEKPIKLGQIKERKLEKFGKDLCWGLDETIAIFLRDALRHLAKTTHGYPDCYDENWNMMTTEEWENRDKNKDYYKAWIDHLNGIADKLDYSLSDAWESLTDENRVFLEYFYNKYPFFQSLTNPDMVSQDDREKMDDIHRKTSEEQEKRNIAGMEALEDIKKILYHLWS